MEPENKNERDIRWIMIAGTAIAFGFMAASLEALRSSPSGFSFQISARTFFAFVLGAAAVFPFWKIVFNLVSGNRQRKRHICAALLLLLIGVAAFLYPTRFVPKEKLKDLYTGLAFAVCALSMLAGLLVVIGRFFEADGRGETPSNTQAPKE
jgi:hypothetical protein